MADKQESDKTEQALEINTFNEPLELSGPNAWARLISNLVFMSPGTIPTDPEMGCEIQKYEFSFIDDVKEEIEEKITDQVRTYFPDIPLQEITVTSEENSTGRNILLIILSFSYEDNENITVVAAEKQDNVLNFSIVS